MVWTGSFLGYLLGLYALMPHAIYEKTANTFSLFRVHSCLISDLAYRSNMLNPKTITAHISIVHSQELTHP